LQSWHQQLYIQRGKVRTLDRDNSVMRTRTKVFLKVTAAKPHFLLEGRKTMKTASRLALLGLAALTLARGQGVISTVAGNGSLNFTGDGGPATSAAFNLATDVAVDSEGNLYIADKGNNRIRKVKDGVISTVAGNGKEDS